MADETPKNYLIGKHIRECFDWEGNPVTSETGVKGIGWFREDKGHQYPVLFDISADVPPIFELIAVEALENTEEAYSRNGMHGGIRINVRAEGNNTIMEIQDYAGGIPKAALDDMARGATVMISKKKEGRPTNVKTPGGRGYRILDEGVKRRGGYITRETIEEYGRRGTKITVSIPK